MASVITLVLRHAGAADPYHFAPRGAQHRTDHV
jgi:hypothetical protein